jgi:radical SAM protein with 4Fe4S-binding SPASM domain
VNGDRPIYPHSPGERFARLDYAVTPLVVIWEMTRACSLVCTHCRADAIPRRHPLELDTAEGFDLMDQVKELGAPVFVLTGGDPLMRRDFYELVEYGTKIGLRVSASPSATRLLNRAALDRAKQAGLVRVAISLDGAGPQTHDAFRGVPGSFDMTIRALQEARDAGLEIQVGTTVTRRTAPDLPLLLELISDLDVSMWNVFFLVPVGRGQIEDCLDAQGHEEVLIWLEKRSRETPFPIKTTEAPHYRRIAAASGRPVPGSGVGDGKGFVFISHLGEIQPSGFLPLTAGYIRQRGLTSAYRDSPLFRDLRDPDLLKGKCGACEFKRVCGGSRARAYALTGDYLGPDPACAYQPPPGSSTG